MLRLLFFACLLGAPLTTLAQLGGNSTYRFLSLPASARSAALGGAHISTRDSDLALVYDNPALLDSNMRKHFSLTYINYLADINFGYAAYAREIGKWGTFGFGLQFLNYGRFTEADFTGVQTGEFSAGEYSFNITYAYEFDSLFAVGGTFKTIYSSLTGEYQSFGNALDLGATYRSKNKRFSAALVVKNLGVQLKPYVSGNRESLPLEIQAGISRKMKHAPFRVSILARNLQKWDLTFDNPFQDDPDEEEEDDPFNFGEEDGENFFTFEKLMRHMVFAVEFVPKGSFNLRLAYNHQRKQEMQLADRAGLTGISFGVGFRVARFHLGYSIARYHLGGASHHLSITTNLGAFTSRSTS